MREPFDPEASVDSFLFLPPVFIVGTVAICLGTVTLSAALSLVNFVACSFRSFDSHDPRVQLTG
jgi:hypothetical protein